MRKINVLICVSLGLFGCSDNKKIDGIEARIAATEEKISALQSQVNTLHAKNKEMESTIKLNELIKDIDRYAYLTPGEAGYSTIRFDLGVLTVNLTDIKAYANGSKITLKLGNTLSSSIDGLKGTFEWGKVDEGGSPLSEQTKTKEITLSETLVAGSWTEVSVVLDGIPPTEFGFLRLKNFSHTGIRLRN